MVNKAAFGKERVILTRQGKDLVAVVPVEDLALLDELEARRDNELADAALANAKVTGEKPVSWKAAKRKLGL